ncbi:MAG TPA: glycerol-3-phosphate 1-O-acyltransferase PlsY [Candidatus Eisenbacteria bacterium]|nr:glycerol-3-phosphate 1-O-acyltransferase PlsY [Candidatus Eisenbacteria bacterium]
MPLLIASVLVGFLLGGIPSGLLIGRARGVDLRTAGSKNIGATNAFRVLGPRWGALVFLLDALKGFAATVFPRVASGIVAGGPAGGSPHQLLAPTLAAGIAAILGHVFSPWLAFKGGRGVATSLGVFLGILPRPTLLAFGLWIILVAISRRVSVGSIGAAISYPFLVAWQTARDPQRGILITVSAVVALLIIVRHLPNIRRLLKGTEPPILGAASERRP